MGHAQEEAIKVRTRIIEPLLQGKGLLNPAAKHEYRPHDAGYTLVETMTTLAVIGLLASAVLLMAPGPERKAQDFVERFAARLDLAGQEGLQRNRTIGLFITDEGFGFARLERSGWTQAEPGSPLSFRAWPEGVDSHIEQTAIPDNDEGLAARFDPLGGATPARITFSGGGQRWRVELDGEGKAHVAQAD